MRARRQGIARGTLALAMMVAALAGCAYYNTLYNANERFREAEKASMSREATERRVETDGSPEALAAQNPQAREYEAVIEKCRNMIARYPDSRHVDDAMLLIARSLYRLERFDEAAAALDSLKSRFPKTDLKTDAQFLKGKALAAAEHYDVAVTELTTFVDEYRGHDSRPEALYLLCTSQMQLGLSDNAVATLKRLEEDHGRSSYRFRAQVDMARILSEKGLHKESLAVYKRLNASRVPESMRYDVWIGMAQVQEAVGDHVAALATIAQLRGLPLTPDREPVMNLLSARALSGADSTEAAIKKYKDVASRFGRGVYGAEANYRLGVMYEATDSLRTAQRYYQQVPRAYSQSEFAEEAIKRNSDISRILKIEEAAGDDSPEAVALRTFSMAEVQFFQFNSAEKAVPAYEKIVAEFGDSEYAPRAAYALGYIHGVVLGDSVKAREWYDVLRSRYPDSQQALLARAFYAGAPPPPPMSDMMRFARAKPVPSTSKPAQPAHDRGLPGPDVPPPPALPDSLIDPEQRERGVPPPDTTR